MERNILHEQVWPEIRTYCRDRGVRFQMIDLRWGISEEADQDHRTVAICLEEISRCQKISPDFSFIALLGDRHGSRLLPDVIPAPDFDKLLAVLSPDEQARLQTWYRLDLNALPAGAYVLLPRGGEHAVANSAFAEFAAWEPMQSELLALLTRACQQAEVTATTRFAILASVSEQEIQAGIFEAPDKGARALCFRRNLVRQEGETIAGGVFEAFPLGLERLEALQARLATLPGGIIPFTAQYLGRAITDAHLLSFATLVKAQVIAHINQILDQRQASGYEAVAASHQRFADERLRHFTGRTHERAQIVNYLKQPARTPLLVTGQGGVGKTALLLQALIDTEVMAPQSIILHRFIGGSAPHNDVAALLRDLSATLAERYEQSDKPIPAIREDLIRQLPGFLALATNDHPLILYLDALDQLRDAIDDLTWLPATLPDHVHIVCSILKGPIVVAWHTIHPNVPSIYLEPLDPASIATTVRGLFADMGRRLQPDQERLVLLRCSSSGLPLYLRLVVDATQHWNSWQVGPAIPALADDVPGVLQQRFKQLESPSAHGPMLVQHALGLIGAAKNGLAEDELLDVLGQDQQTREAIVRHTQHAPPVDQVPIVLWLRLYADLDALLTERARQGVSLITFYHRQVEEAIQAHYLSGANGIARHRELAYYFGSQAPYLINTPDQPLVMINERMVSELAIQQAKGQLQHFLKRTIFDATFLQARIQAGTTQIALEDVSLMEEDKDAQFLALTLQLSGHILDRSPDELMNQVVGRGSIDLPFHNLPRRFGIFFKLLTPTLRRSGGALSRIFTGHTDGVLSCAISPDGRYALSGSRDQTLRLWDLSSGKQKWVVSGHSGEIRACMVTPDGCFALSASTDQTLKLWELQSGMLVRTFIGHSDPVRACVVTLDGYFVLSGSYDKTLRLWDIQSGRLINTFTGHTDGVMSCTLSPDGRYALSASRDRTLRLWDLRSGETVRIFEGHTDEVRACSITPDGRYVLSASTDHTLRQWDMHSGQAVRLLQEHSGRVDCCLAMPDGRYALSGSYDRTLHVWDLQTGEEVRGYKGHTDTVTTCAVTPNEQYALSGSLDTTLCLWDLQSRETNSVSQGHTRGIWSCDVTSDGQYALSASTDQTLRLWDLSTNEVVQVLQGHTGSVKTCTISPDGHFAISGSEDTTLRLWNLRTGDQLRVLQGHSRGIWSCAISPNGRFALSGSEDTTMLLWNLQTGETMRVFQGHSQGIWACPISSDGFFALSCSEDSTLRLWDLQTGETLRTLRGHLGSVNCCTITRDGRFALSGSQDTTLRLWDLESGELVRVYRGHLNSVSSCLVMWNGHYALSTSEDRSIRLWDLSSSEPICQWFADAPIFCCATSQFEFFIVAGDSAGSLHCLQLKQSTPVSKSSEKLG